MNYPTFLVAFLFVIIVFLPFIILFFEKKWPNMFQIAFFFLIL